MKNTPLSRTPEYVSWKAMRCRCSNKEWHAYDRYGGRGVTVCTRWAEYKNFINDVGPKPTPKHTLERLDNDKGYEPGNVVWATRKLQARNRSSNRAITVNGVTKTLVEWSEESGIGRETIRKRLLKGVSPEVAVSTPVAKLRRKGVVC